MQTTLSNEIYDKIEQAKKIASIYPDESLNICKTVYIMAKENKLLIEEGYALIGMSLASR